MQFTYVQATWEAFQPSKENILHFLWVIFALLDPDWESGSGYGSRDPTPLNLDPDTDPDPQHWPKQPQQRRQELEPHLKNIDGGAEVLGAELEQGGNPGQESHQGRGGLRRVVQQRQPQLQTVLPQHVCHSK